VNRNRIRMQPWLAAVILALAVNASAASWKEKVLYSFQGGLTDGSTPAGGVVFDKAGNLYGATTGGGTQNCTPIAYACGLVFQLSPPARKGDAWTETVIYQFKGKSSNDASVPTSGLMIDAAGNLYGVTAYGGSGDCVLLGTNAGCGTVYELTPPTQKGGAWTETLLYSFLSGNDGYFPQGNLTFDAKGNLYGATLFGGGKGTTCNQFYGGNCGTVFELSPPKQKAGVWTEQVLHSFAGGTDGANPNGGLVSHNSIVYGTTLSGGNQGCTTGGTAGCGTVFQLNPVGRQHKWAERKLHVFAGGSQDTNNPNFGVVLDRNGNLFGTTTGGYGGDSGAIFELIHPSKSGGSWKEVLLLEFQNCNGQYECRPLGLMFDSAGSLYSETGLLFLMKRPRNLGGWKPSLIYKFKGPPDGDYPIAEIFKTSRTILGATLYGGTGKACQGGCGTVYEVGQ
jgi:hypothetical protein